MKVIRKICLLVALLMSFTATLPIAAAGYSVAVLIPTATGTAIKNVTLRGSRALIHVAKDGSVRVMDDVSDDVLKVFLRDNQVIALVNFGQLATNATFGAINRINRLQAKELIDDFAQVKEDLLRISAGSTAEANDAQKLLRQMDEIELQYAGKISSVVEGESLRFGKNFPSKFSSNTTLSLAEKNIAKEAYEILNSSEFERIMNAYLTKNPIQIEINGRTISYDDAPFSGMTWFERNGFNIRREALSRVILYFCTINGNWR